MAASLYGSDRRARKITVNERIERILHGALLQIEDRRLGTGGSSRGESREEQELKRRARQLSTLYVSSPQDKFVKSRVNAELPAPKSVPKHMHLAMESTSSESDGRSTVLAPVKPVRCYAKVKLQEMADLEVQEQQEQQRKQFRAPDFSPPKPWYKGYSSTIKAPSGTVESKVRRYGAYGTIKMMASETVAGTAPHFSLHESQSLDALAEYDRPDPWSPTLEGSPSTWPEDANHTHGAPLKSTQRMLRCSSPDFRFPTHCVGKEATDARDAHFERMRVAHCQDARVLEAAFDDEKARRRKEIQYNKEKLAHWKENLHFEPLSSKMDHPLLKVNTKRARELTILHTPEFSAVSRFHEQTAKLTEKRFELRWRNMAIVIDVMKRTPCRRPVLQDIDKLLGLAYEMSLKNVNAYELSRQQFWELLQREYGSVELKYVNRLFSSYDCQMEDRIDMRLFLGTVRALRVQQGTPLEIVAISLQDFDKTKQGIVSSVVPFLTVMTMCCASDEEQHEMDAKASQLWQEMCRQFSDHRERRRERRLRGRIDQEDDVASVFGSESDTGTEDSDAITDVDSLVFLGKHEERKTLPIKFIKKALLLERDLLHRFTELLNRRREQCFSVPPPKSRGAAAAAPDELSLAGESAGPV
ncbi:hypothetical protein P43SY_010115 [Pythium insidiosum]|uniref:Uncharacterized protein n=1 Tax=Pythium insidiosum TaxID=114742 RepID=A0AAD5LW89_PYTIN|nr:hypothetical protein P43SY_010115 [Pythium insidiosum]